MIAKRWQAGPSLVLERGPQTGATAVDRPGSRPGIAKLPTRSFRYGKALGEQVDDVAPGSLRVLRVVADARDRGVVDRRVVEGVQGAAVYREAPVDACGLHLSGERVPLRGRHDRVFRSDPGPHRA